MLSNKIIVVTGAAGRLGRRIVRQFAEDGASIAAVVRTEEQARKLPFPEGGEGWAFPVDLTNERLVKAAFEQILNQFTRIDAVVHTVGSWDSAPLAETTLAHWDHIMRVNLLSTFLCFREAVRVMDGPGRLIAFASKQGADGGIREQGAYAASKAGLIRFVEALSDEYRDRGITAHAVAPSTILHEDDGEGVRAGDVVEICRSIIADTGEALNGSTVRAYGSA